MKYLTTYFVLLNLLFFLTTQLCYGQGKLKYLNHAANGKSDGTSWQDAYIQIDSAFNNAVSGDTIWIAKGEYSFSNAKRVTLSGLNLTIIGGFKGTETSIHQREIYKNPTIVQNYSGPVEVFVFNIFYLQDGNYTIDGLTIQNGGARGLYPQFEDPDCYSLGPEGFMCKGVGIYMYSQDTLKPCNLTLKNCTIRNNAAIEGGGVYVNPTNSGRCKLLVDSCLFTKNYSKDNCGGLSYDANEFNTDDIIIKNTTFLKNYSGFSVGGIGIQNFGNTGKILIENCKFFENKAYVVGAATVNHLPTTKAYINNCEFTKNVATTWSGGGIAALNFLFGEVNNCIFLGNITFADNLHVRTVDFKNCLFAKNRSYKPQSNLISTSEWGLPKPNEESNFYN